MVSLFADSVRGHVAAGADAAREIERQAREIATLETRRADLEKRAALLDSRVEEGKAEARRLEKVVGEVRAELAALHEKFRLHHESHAKDKLFLEQQLAETRDEVHKLLTSRLWRTANLYWRGRRAVSGAAKTVLRPLLGRPPSDWAGPDPSAAAAKRAAPMKDESRQLSLPR